MPRNSRLFVSPSSRLRVSDFVIRRSLVLSGLIVAAIVALVAASGVAHPAGAIARQETAAIPADHPLVGSWAYVFRYEDEQRGTLGLITFAADGTVAESVVGRSSLQAGYGAWIATGARTARFTVVRLATGVRASRRSRPFASQVTGTIELNPAGDQWSGVARAAMFPPNPDLRLDDLLLIEGQRIEVAPALPMGTPAANAPTPTPSAPLTAAPGTLPTAVSIDSVDLAYIPDEVTIPADTPVTVTLVNRGEAVHGFTIDALGINVLTEPGETASTVINAPPGYYEFYSDVPGHREAGMVGTLRVAVVRTPVAATPATAEASPTAGG